MTYVCFVVNRGMGAAMRVGTAAEHSAPTARLVVAREGVMLGREDGLALARALQQFSGGAAPAPAELAAVAALEEALARGLNLADAASGEPFEAKGHEWAPRAGDALALARSFRERR